MSADTVSSAAPSLSSPSAEAESLREGQRPRLSAVELVPIRDLLPADTPRSAGQDVQHARTLAESGAVLPPITVHRATMRVVDGMHRLRAAIARGEDTIRARFFDGSEQDAFVIAVQENIAHGLPLSAADRSAAASRIVTSHPQWSDRAIALTVGLSARTVGEIRRAALGELVEPAARMGRDGRVRPLNSSAGRIRASVIIREMPQASLRQIAERAGISPSTVRDVRDRMSRGEDPVPDSLRGTGTGSGSGTVSGTGSRRRKRARLAEPVEAPLERLPEAMSRRNSGSPAAGKLRALMKDPSLRLTDRGRVLLRLLSSQAVLERQWAELGEAVPEHCAEVVSRLARESAIAWSRFAEELEHKSAAPSRQAG